MVAEEFAKVLEKHDQEFNRDHRAAGPAVGGKNELRQARQSPKKLQKAFDDLTSFHDSHHSCLDFNLLFFYGYLSVVPVRRLFS